MPILEIVIVLGLLTLTEILRAIAVRSKWLYQRGNAKKISGDARQHHRDPQMNGD